MDVPLRNVCTYVMQACDALFNQFHIANPRQVLLTLVTRILTDENRCMGDKGEEKQKRGREGEREGEKDREKVSE